MSTASNVAIAFLVIFDLFLVIFVVYSYSQLKSCEGRESIFCLQWICPNGQPARRIHNGTVIESGPYGYIAPPPGKKGKRLDPSESCS